MSHVNQTEVSRGDEEVVNAEKKPILADTFKYFKKNQLVDVNLYNDSIELINISKEKKVLNKKVYSLRDIANAKLGKGRAQNDTKAYLTLYLYLKSNEEAKQNVKRRKRLAIELEYSKLPSFDDNLQYVSKWQAKLDALLKQENLDRFNKYYSAHPELLANNISPNEYFEKLKKPFLILINPKSGAGKAKDIYHEHIVPVTAEANLNNTIVFTQHSNHAREYVRTLKLDDYRGIVVVSGDGLIYEVVNGLMDRSDWEKAIKIPIAQIPGGSANANACCISYLTNEAFRNISLENFAKNFTFNLVKSISVPFDLVIYELCNKKLVTSCLSFEWAIVADVDLESEKYRYLGGFRFVVGALKRILKLRVYRGRLSFLPSDASTSYKPKNDKVNMIKRESTKQGERKQSANVASASTSSTDQNNNNLNSKFKYLNPIDEPVPSDWVVIEDNFVLLLIVHFPLISPDFLAAPDSTFNDGNMHLIFIKEGMSKGDLLQLFGQTENGDHLNNPQVEYVKIKAFRLEPLQLNGSSATENDGVMMVDGERVPHGVIQAEIMPSMGSCLANL